MIKAWVRLNDTMSREDIVYMLGIIPEWLSEQDPRPAREQLHSAYGHGGGWRPFEGFTMASKEDLYWLLYPGDPPTRSLAYCMLRNEIVIVYEHAWVAIRQKDGSFEVCRMD